VKISVAVVSVWLAFAPAAVSPTPESVPQRCCGECNGTGMVWSGDRLLRFPCPCPPTCPCAKNRPKMTLSGTCVGGNCNVR
jgi:hypothetical protein